MRPAETLLELSNSRCGVGCGLPQSRLTPAASCMRGQPRAQDCPCRQAVQHYRSLPSRTMTSAPTRTVASGKKSQRTTPPRTLPPSSVLSPRLIRTTPLPYP
jgi:hypothetical protein